MASKEYQTMRILVLEAQGPKIFQNDQGKDVAYNNCIARVGEREIKFKVQGDLNLNEYEDQEVTVKVKVTPSRTQAPVFTIVEVAEQKKA